MTIPFDPIDDRLLELLFQTGDATDLQVRGLVVLIRAGKERELALHRIIARLSKAIRDERDEQEQKAPRTQVPDHWSPAALAQGPLLVTFRNDLEPAEAQRIWENIQATFPGRRAGKTT